MDQNEMLIKTESGTIVYNTRTHDISEFTNKGDLVYRIIPQIHCNGLLFRSKMNSALVDFNSRR